MPDIPPLIPPRRSNKPPRKSTYGRQHYGHRHQQLRAALLAAHPLCQMCQSAWATDAAHKRYPALTTDDYLALCGPCHREYDGRPR